MTDEFLKTLATISTDLARAIHPAAQERLLDLSGEMLRHMRASRPGLPCRAKRQRSDKDYLNSNMATKILTSCAGYRMNRTDIAKKIHASKDGGFYRKVLNALIRAGKIKKNGKLLYEIPARVTGG